MSIDTGEFIRILQQYDSITKAVKYEWVHNIIANLHHSSLLERLNNNLPLYKFPPPKAMSYPWYDLLDNGSDKVWVVNVPSQPIFHFKFFPIIVIEQTVWELEETIKEGDEYIASWPYYKLRIKLIRNTTETRFSQYLVTVLETENVVVDNYWEVAKL